jgi:hypothetical protein
MWTAPALSTRPSSSASPPPLGAPPESAGLTERAAGRYDVDTVDPDHDGYTMLSYAAAAGRMDVVRFLVSSDADIAYHDYNDQTPLMLARQNGHSEAPSPSPAPPWHPLPPAPACAPVSPVVPGRWWNTC